MKYKRIAWFVLTAVLISACGHLHEADRPAPPGDADPTRSQLVQHAHRLLGVSYRYGGDSPAAGMDCSGLVFFLYNQLGIAVPRTAQQQFRHTVPVGKNQLRPGDLVFFRLENKINHVGIYTGAGDFIHAPSHGKEVQKSSLEHPYWQQRYVRGGRLLN